MSAPYEGNSINKDIPGVKGTNNAEGDGVFGDGGKDGRGVVGIATKATAVEGNSKDGAGVWGSSTNNEGAHAESNSSNTAAMAAFQLNKQSQTAAIFASNAGTGEGLYATSPNGAGVKGVSENREGVYAESKSSTTAAMAAFQLNSESGTVAFFAKHMGNRTAARFEGDVEVTGDIRLINADCAEDFNIGSDVMVEPGTVMVLGEKDALFPCQSPYDKCVAGVVSGAGDYKPGIVLDKQKSDRTRQPIALLGKVYCKVDAEYGAIEVGDMLTTSPVIGHAMKASNPSKAFGAVIGKALRPLKNGQGTIPILIALQ